MALLELRGVHAGYGQPVIHDLTFVVHEREFVVLMGLNGAGKSTTARVIVGVVPVAAGQVWFDGSEITGCRPYETVAKGLTLVPEGRHVFPQLTVEQNLQLGAWVHRRRPDVIRDAMRVVVGYFPRLAERAAQPAGTLSGGEQQMLAIGRALMSRPRLLLVDEASLGLAPSTADELFAALARAVEDGLTVVAVEQSQAVLRYAGRALLMAQGAVVADTTALDVTSKELEGWYLGT